MDLSFVGPAESETTGDEVLLDRPADGVTRLTLNRPAKLNALTVTLVARLHHLLDEVAEDPACRVVVLTGAGRGFCAGVDLGGYGTRTAVADKGRVQKGFATQAHIASLIPHLRRTPQPVIAAVNGAATGGGLALVLGSDIRIAAASARFNAAFVRIGLSACDIGVSWALPRIVGAGRAHELMLTGRLIDAAEAERIGLVLEAVPDDALMDRVLGEAAMVAANSPMGVRMTKEVMWSALEIPGQQAAIDLENRTQIMTGQTADHREAVAAFLEKRAPAFEDR